MNINITDKEFDAICDATSGIEGQLESAEEGEDIEYFKNILKKLYSIISKYKTAREKHELFKQVRSIIAEDKNLVRSVRPRDIDRMARKAVKKYLNK